MIGNIATVILAVVFLSTTSVCAQGIAQEGEMMQGEEMAQGVADDSRSPTTRAGAQVSTLGLGVFAAWDASDTFAVRGMINYYEQDLDRHEAGIEYNVDLQLQSVGLILDWHAFRSGFRVSGGAFINQNEFSAMAEDSGIEIGETLYDGVLDTLVDFNGMAPYLADSAGSADAVGRGSVSALRRVFSFRARPS